MCAHKCTDIISTRVYMGMYVHIPHIYKTHMHINVCTCLHVCINMHIHMNNAYVHTCMHTYTRVWGRIAD